MVRYFSVFKGDKERAKKKYFRKFLWRKAYFVNLISNANKNIYILSYLKTSSMTTEDTDPKDLVHKVQHFRQRWDWDCGISCVLMVLSPDQREHFLKEFQHICHIEGIEKSTWTIDLCYLLKRFGIKHRMYTSLAGVNQDYRRQSYYRNIIDSDQSRVERRFKLASSVGIDVREQLLSRDELLTHLRTAPAILLVDAGVLACDICKHNKLRSEFRSCFGGGYAGHYILVVGRARGRLLYRDPARAPRLCAAPPPRAGRTTTASSSTPPPPTPREGTSAYTSPKYS